MKRKILLSTLLLTFVPVTFLTSCNNTQEKVAINKPQNYNDFINSEYSTGENITWKPNHTIISVHDGDTFKDENNKTYRLFAVDTAEITTFGTTKTQTPTTGLEYFWALKATNYVKKFILHKNVQIIERTHDKYGRIVASVFYKDTNDKTKNLAMELARNGLARVAYISKNEGLFKVNNVFYDYMDAIRTKARKNKIGIYKYNSNDFTKIFPKQNIVQ